MNALLIGCGSKFGLDVTNSLLSQGCTVNLISGSRVNDDCINQLTVDWQTFNVTTLEKFLQSLNKVDLILFNQNASSLSTPCFESSYYTTLDLWKQEKMWSQSYFTSCILPFHIVHTLGDKCNSTTKVCWMLSSMVYSHKNKNQVGHADYVGNKYQNYVIMKNFSMTHPACFFGINPDSIIDTNTSTNLENMIKYIDETERSILNGQVIKFDLQLDHNFSWFNAIKSKEVVC